MKISLTVNGLPFEAEYRDEDVEGVFVPLLKRWSALAHERSGFGDRRDSAGTVGRVVVLLAAPPGTGKTTLALCLERLSRTVPGCVPVQALGMDGFHFPNAYLDEHVFCEDGVEVPLRSRKGAYFTFDLQKLRAAIADLRSPAPKPWPAYSRTLHDVVPGQLPVTGEIVLVEGNYLLLDRSGWRDLASLADDTAFLAAEPSLLHDRLVGRKVRGGMAQDDAEAWYRASDGRNVDEVLARRLPADVELELGEDGGIRLM